MQVRIVITRQAHLLFPPHHNSFVAAPPSTPWCPCSKQASPGPGLLLLMQQLLYVSHPTLRPSSFCSSHSPAATSAQVKSPLGPSPIRFKSTRQISRAVSRCITHTALIRACRRYLLTVRSHLRLGLRHHSRGDPLSQLQARRAAPTLYLQYI